VQLDLFAPALRHLNGRVPKSAPLPCPAAAAPPAGSTSFERVALDPAGNYSMQNLLESVHRLRLEALELTKQVRGAGGVATGQRGPAVRQAGLSKQGQGSALLLLAHCCAAVAGLNWSVPVCMPAASGS
jgi:hypothetical protein